MLTEYHPADMSLWHGRIDSEVDYDSFRWHQYIQGLDLSKDITSNQDRLAFVLIAYQIDEGIRLNKGRIGASEGPDKIREFLCNKPCSFNNDLKIYDGGNISLKTTVESAQQTLASLVKKCLNNNYFPIVIGGGHDLSYGSMSGILNHLDLKKNNFGIINFDAHFDLREHERSTSGTMFNQIYRDIKAIPSPFNHLSIGIQKSSNTVSLFKFAKMINSKYMLAQDINLANIAINEYKLNEFLKDLDNIYVCCCCDVFSSPYAPGVSSPQPMGIEPDLFLVMLKQIIDTKKLVAFDIAEVSPRLDDSSATASLGALIVYSLINYMGEKYQK
jgi:formiminoglutamase